ncbi:MAG TPA: hypothetical protein VHS99_05520, partial [Chloroflexota bacterium]|nr:hypothetical protein [Chloroflexota bacterium]
MQQTVKPHAAPPPVAPDTADHRPALDHLEEQTMPRPEHPRPDFQRDAWLNLNGRWRFSFDPQNSGEQLRWYHVPHPAVAARTGEISGPIEDPFNSEIVVPFPWESRLSGVGDPNYKGAAWYQHAVEVPQEWAHPAGPPRPDAGGGSSGGAEAALPPAFPPPAGGPSPSPVAGPSPPPSIGAAGRPVSRPPVQWRRRPYLCFGAVDWSAKVWVNGRFVAEHDGGYTPFAVDLSRHVRPGVPATVTVRVWDACDADTPLGKQTDEWYTHSGGIWQTVWLEGRPNPHLSRLHITPYLPLPYLETGRATFTMTITATTETLPRPHQVTVESVDGQFPTVTQTVEVQGGATEATLEVEVPHPHPWSPEDPHLYDCKVTLAPLDPQRGDGAAGGGDGAGKGHGDRLGDGRGEARSEARDRGVADEVRTYFGLRSISTGRWEGKPYEYVFLNGEPVYLRGVLDQAFHPDGLHTYPSDEAIRADVEA